MYLYAADVKLEQEVGPTATNVTGELANAPSVRGISDIAFDASDPGSGVYQAVFSVDGQIVQRTTVDENGGRCVDVGGTADGLPAFLYTQPCKPSASVDVPFDTTRASDGSHRLLVTVTDPAGQSAPVLDRVLTIANPPPAGAPNGTNASAQVSLSVGWAGTRKARLTSSYGRAHTIAGRLTGPGGAPIAGAQIDCTATPAYAGAKTVTIACPKTGADGRFALRVPGGAGSRTLRFAYREHVGDALPVATRTLALAVAAGVRLHVNPRTASVGRSIFFTGRLLGGPIPRGGKQLVLEARSPGGPWIEFDVVKTDRRGRYHASYRFRFPGPASYSFRAVSESEADFPFAAGASNTVGVHER
ncbi:MAG TPA: carboxypeptidase-like regulatory domain-containing protein [Solirubrobacteraceae bacterium]|nr:carboxypeptidase-like regulatory domain-containing protein [Solirubrobacteraceae bacterium]